MKKNTPEFSMNLNRPIQFMLIVGAVTALLSVAGIFLSGASLFFQAYLFAFFFWLGISLGSLVLLLLYFVTGSKWGLTIRRVAEAASGSVWVMGILFLPLLAGLPTLYPWARPAEVAANAILQYKTFYLNVPFFIGRAVLYFAVWIGMSLMANRWARAQASAVPGEDAALKRPQGLAAISLVLFALTMTFASVDWLMSLQPLWTSTAFGLILIMGQVLTAMSFAVLMLNLFPSLSLGRHWGYQTTPVPYKDLGALMLTFVMGWAYVSFFQFLIQWGGDIPREVVWYAVRSTGGWDVVLIIITIFEFVLPFMILLSIRARYNLHVLAGLGGMLLVVYLVNLFWHVKPAFYPGQFAVSWLDIVLPVAMGGIWMAVFLYNLARRPALNLDEQTALQLNASQQTVKS